MGLFSNSRRNKHINSLNKQEIENEIEEKKQEIGQLKKEIDLTKVEIAKINDNHEKQVKALQEKQNAIVDDFNSGKEKLLTEVEKLNIKKEKYKKDYEKDQEEIDAKIAELKKKKKALLNEKLQLDTESFDRKKKRIENKISKLKQEKEQLDNFYNEKMSSIQTEYENLIDGKKQDSKKANDNLQEIKAQTEIDVAALEAKQAEEKRLHQEKLKQLDAEHKETINKIKSEEDTQITAIKNELSTLYTEVDSLSTIKNGIIKQLNSTKTNCEHEYNVLVSRFDSENARLQKEYDLLKNNLELNQKKLKEQTIAHKNEYDSKMTEIAHLTEVLANQEKDLNNDIAQVDEKIKDKYTKYFLSLDDEYSAQKEKLEKELSVLKYSLEQQEEELKKRNEFLQERFENRDLEYKKSVDNYTKQVNETQNSLTSFIDECNKRIIAFKNNIDKAKIDNAIAIEELNKRYANEIDNYMADAFGKRQEINNKISDTRLEIDNLNADIERLNADLNDYISTYEKKKTDLVNVQASIIDSLTSKKDETENSLKKLEEIIKEKADEHSALMDELLNKQTEIKNNYKSTISELKADYDKKFAELNDNNTERIKKANADHKEVIDGIEAKYQNEVKKANDVYAEKQKQYDDNKNSLDSDIADIQNDYNNKIKQLEDHKADILAQMEVARNNIHEKQVEYDEEIKQLEDNRIIVLDEMAKKQEEALDNITNEYENIPNAELRKIQAEFEEKQKEYNDNANYVVLKKHEIDAEYAALENEKRLERQKASDELEIVTKEYEKVKSDLEKLEQTFDDELAKRNRELADYKDELDTLIDEAKQQKANEEAIIIKRYEDEYADLESQLNEKLNTVVRRYDEQLKLAQQDFNVMNDSLDSLICDIDHHRANVENDYINKFNAAAEETKKVQQEYDELVNQNDIKKRELHVAIEQKKADVASEIENIKNNYDSVLASKKKAYDDYISEVRTRCNDIRNNVAEMEKQKQIESANIETYVNEKRTAMQNLEDDTKNYLNEIINKTKNIADKRDALTKTSNERIHKTKQLIASTMSEYDDLLRTKAKLIADNSALDKNLMEQTATLFKERIDTLKDSHNNMLAELATKHDTALANIASQIENLEASKPEKLHEYEKHIEEISLAYDALLRDEKLKKDKILDYIDKAKKDQDVIIKDSTLQLSQINDDSINKKKQMLDEYKQELAIAANDFNDTTAKIKNEFEKLVSDEKTLGTELSVYSSIYNDVDAEIINRTTDLKSKCLDCIDELRDIIINKRENESKELAKADKLSSNSIADIFKTHN